MSMKMANARITLEHRTLIMCTYGIHSIFLLPFLSQLVIIHHLILCITFYTLYGKQDAPRQTTPRHNQ